ASSCTLSRFPGGTHRCCHCPKLLSVGPPYAAYVRGNWELRSVTNRPDIPGGAKKHFRLLLLVGVLTYRLWYAPRTRSEPSDPFLHQVRSQDAVRIPLPDVVRIRRSDLAVCARSQIRHHELPAGQRRPPTARLAGLLRASHACDNRGRPLEDSRIHIL